MILKFTIFLSSEKLMLFYNFWQNMFCSWADSVNSPYVMKQFLHLGFDRYNPSKHTHWGLLPPCHPLQIKATCKVHLGVQSLSRTQRGIIGEEDAPHRPDRAPGLARCSSKPPIVRGSPLARPWPATVSGQLHSWLHFCPILVFLCYSS